MLMILIQTDQSNRNGLLARLEAEVGQIFETWQPKSKVMKVRRCNDGWRYCVMRRRKEFDMNRSLDMRTGSRSYSSYEVECLILPKGR